MIVCSPQPYCFLLIKHMPISYIERMSTTILYYFRIFKFLSLVSSWLILPNVILVISFVSPCCYTVLIPIKHNYKPFSFCSNIQGMQQYYRGQYDNAESTSKSAKKWTICGIVSGVIKISLWCSYA